MIPKPNAGSIEKQLRESNSLWSIGASVITACQRKLATRRRERVARFELYAAGVWEPVTAPASISPTDPAARWTAVGGPASFAYSTNYGSGTVVRQLRNRRS